MAVFRRSPFKFVLPTKCSMDESSIPEGESWLYLEDTAGSIEEATYRLKNMALLDYITECYKAKKGSQ